MEIRMTKNGGELTVAPVGRLNSATSDEFSEFLAQNFTEDIETLVIDFTDVDFISSKGLRVLVATYKDLNGRSMEITGSNVSVMEILRISGLLKVFKVR